VMRWEFVVTGLAGVVCVTLASAEVGGSVHSLSSEALTTIRGGTCEQVCRHDLDVCVGCIGDCRNQGNGTGCGETDPEKLRWRCEDYQGGSGCLLGPPGSTYGKKCRCTDEDCVKKDERYFCGMGPIDCEIPGT